MPVIDASVYVALINEHELGHARSWSWLNAVRAQRQSVVAPGIFLPEVAAALSRGMDDISLAHRVRRRLNRSRLIRLVPVTLTLTARAAEIAAEHRIRGCDAVHVALAEQLQTSLVTLDQQQLERGSQVVPTHQP